MELEKDNMEYGEPDSTVILFEQACSQAKCNYCCVKDFHITHNEDDSDVEITMILQSEAREGSDLTLRFHSVVNMRFPRLASDWCGKKIQLLAIFLANIRHWQREGTNYLFTDAEGTLEIYCEGVSVIPVE